MEWNMSKNHLENLSRNPSLEISPLAGESTSASMASRREGNATSASHDLAARTRIQLARLESESVFYDLEHPVTLLEGVKILCMLPIALWRLLCILWMVAVAWIAVPAIVPRTHGWDRPIPYIRASVVRAWIRMWASLALMAAGFYRIPVKGWKNYVASRSLGAPIVFNHESYVDPLVLVALFAPSGIAKSGTADIPFVGKISRALQFVFVARRGTNDPKNVHVVPAGTDVSALILQRSKDDGFPPLMIAPEATTKSRPCLLKFKNGVFKTGLPVLPVVLKYKGRHFVPRWGIEYSTPFHVWRLLSQFANKLEVEILPPYVPSQEEVASPELYAENVRVLMGKTLGVPLVNQGVSDLMMLSNVYHILPGPLGRKLVKYDISTIPPEDKKHVGEGILEDASAAPPITAMGCSKLLLLFHLVLLVQSTSSSPATASPFSPTVPSSTRPLVRAVAAIVRLSLSLSSLAPPLLVSLFVEFSLVASRHSRERIFLPPSLLFDAGALPLPWLERQL